jgi:hypothetical protein
MNRNSTERKATLMSRNAVPSAVRIAGATSAVAAVVAVVVAAADSGKE